MEPIEAISTPNQHSIEQDQKDDDIEIVTLNDVNDRRVSIDLDRAGTTVIHLESNKDLHHAKNKENTGKRGNSKEKKNHKELSQIPYNLERLHNNKNMLDVLRVTKLRDLFAVSYIFRYIVCVIIGCISFFSLAFLWKVIFEINTCRIEGEDRKFKYMPFAFGFMTAYKNGLLVSAPLLYILLPTVGVVYHHRTRFIVAYLLCVFILFTCYGFYAVSWTTYSYIASSILGVLALIIFFYWGGYFAFWVIFPLASAAFAAIMIMSLMREYVWTFVNSDPVIFGIVYPMYLTVLQVITFKCMLWFRLPYRIRQFFTNICPHCCCKTENNGQTPVYYDESQFNSFWTPSQYDLKYIQKRNSTKTEKQMNTEQIEKELEVTKGFETIDKQKDIKEDIETNTNINNNIDANDTDNKEQDNNNNNDNEQKTDDIKTDINTTDNSGNHENADTQIIIKTRSLHNRSKSSHRYKSTELELTVEDVWSNDILFVAGGTVIVLMESMRVAGMVALKDDISALILNVISSILLECAGRNNLYWEFVYKCILKEPNPELTRFYSSIIGTRYQTEYIPYCVIAMMNLTIFGPTNSCTMRYLGSTVSMGFTNYWWMYPILFLSEIFSDLLASFIKKIGRKKRWFGDDENGDPAREATYVKLKPWMMLCIFIGFFAISLLAFQIDYEAKTGTI